MAASSSSNVQAVSNAIAMLEVSSRKTSSAPNASSEQYHKINFWKKIPIGMVQPTNAKIVKAATIDLCHALLLQEHRNILIEKAALLAVQFRNFYEPSDLLVDHVQLRQFFAINPNIRLNLTEGYGRRFIKGACNWKDDFITSVEQLNEKNALLFGPVFACVLLRMGRHQVPSVALKMSKLGEKSYGGTYLSSLKFPSEQQFVTLLSKYAGAKPSKVLANTIYGGFMYAFHKQDLDASTKGWLNLLALLSLRFYGMPLISLIDDFFSAKWSPLIFKELYFTLAAPRVPHSCEAYSRMYSEFLDDPFWPYSKTFSEDVFQDLTYRANHWLCNVTAFILDKEIYDNVTEEWPTLGPSYQTLVKFEDCSLFMTFDDYEEAKEMYDALRYEFNRPSSPAARIIMNEAMTRKYGPNSKWHY